MTTDYCLWAVLEIKVHSTSFHCIEALNIKLKRVGDKKHMESVRSAI